VAAGFGLGQAALEPWLADGTAPVLAPTAPVPRDNEIDILQFDGRDIRTIWIKGEQWWVAVDVCAAIEIVNYRNVLASLDRDEKGVHDMDTLGGLQEMAIINEPGLYNLLSRSNKPKAKKFWRWVRHEVLPSIRRTGSYSVDRTPIRGWIRDRARRRGYSSQTAIRASCSSGVVAPVQAMSWASRSIRDARESPSGVPCASKRRWYPGGGRTSDRLRNQSKHKGVFLRDGQEGRRPAIAVHDLDAARRPRSRHDPVIPSPDDLSRFIVSVSVSAPSGARIGFRRRIPPPQPSARAAAPMASGRPALGEKNRDSSAGIVRFGS
jgi:hypothetical protein